MPIVVEYGGSLELDPPAPEDEESIMAALTQTDRVRAISLTVTDSVLKKLSAIKRPFLELEDLVLLARDSVPLSLPTGFGRVPRLRRLHATRIAFPALLHFLHSSRNLVDLQLHEVLDPWPFSPGAITNALSNVAQLQSLSLNFSSVAKDISPYTSIRRRTILPVLTRFKFRGISEYLEGLVARIDAPRLEDIEVTFINEFIFDLLALRSFIDRIDMHKSHCRAHILSSERDISLSLMRPGAPTCLKLQLSGNLLTQQLSFMSRFCFHFSAFLFNIEDLHIKTTTSSKWEDIDILQGVLDGAKWLDIIKLFTGVKRFHVEGSISEYILYVWRSPDSRGNPVLPALHKLQIWPVPCHEDWSLREAVVSLVTSRRLSGQPIAVEYEPLCCVDELHGTGTVFLSVTTTMC
jgi:hypothetical protein